MPNREQRIELPPYSMYAATNVYEIEVPRDVDPSGKVVVFGQLRPPVVRAQSDQLYRVPQGMEARLDLISNKFYGTPELWWVIALVNKLQDPITGFESNQQIRVPLKTRMAEEGVLTV